MPSLTNDYHSFVSETNRIAGLLTSASALAPTHRKFIAEIALLRLSILIENSMKSVFCKLSCGATYIDGRSPTILAPQRNLPIAISAMQNLNRSKHRHTLPWNDGAEIRKNIEYIIDPSDGCHQHLKNYASFLIEIRWIRNHIAHKNDGTRRNFVKLIQRYYGAKVPGITCGNLLVSRRVSPTRPLLECYIITAKIMMKDIVRA